VSLTPWNSNFSNDYLDIFGEYEAICETALAVNHGPIGGLFDEKKRGSKISLHCHFSRAWERTVPKITECRGDNPLYFGTYSEDTEKS
jgi:hypothetical protein